MLGSKKNRNSSNVTYDTLISAQTDIKGDLTVSGAIHVDGLVTGNITAEPGSQATVLISEKGRILGDISAPNVIINGEVRGDVRAFTNLELAEKSRITGDVYYANMEMVMGGQVNGQLKHISEDQASSVVALLAGDDKSAEAEAKVD